MASKVTALVARAQDGLYTDSFSFNTGDDLILGQATSVVTYTLQRRANTGSEVWLDTAVTGTLSTTVNTDIPFSSLALLQSIGNAFRFRLSAPTRFWVAVDPGTVETQLGSVVAPVMASPASNQFTPLVWPPPPNYDDLPIVTSFRGLTGLPSGYIPAALAAPGFFPTYTELNRGPSNNWSTTYLTGPVLDWTAYDILITFIAAGLNAVGLSDNYSTGLFSSTGENLMVVSGGGVLYKGVEIGTVGVWISGKTYTLKFKRVGTSVQIIQTNITDAAAPTTYTATNVGLQAPKPIMDSGYSDVKIVEVAEVAK